MELYQDVHKGKFAIIICQYFRLLIIAHIQILYLSSFFSFIPIPINVMNGLDLNTKACHEHQSTKANIVLYLSLIL